MSTLDPQNTGEVVRRGARASLGSQLLVQMGSAGATVILARILTPHEFGIVALAQSIIGVVSLVGLTGITAAIVTSKGDVSAKASTYFWMAVLVSAVAGALLWFAAPTLVRSLGQTDVTPYVRVLLLSPVASLLTLVPLALLQRHLRFGRMNLVVVLGAAVYFAVEIALALAGFGAWAVVVGQVAGGVVSLVVAFVAARWLPLARPRVAEVRQDVNLLGNLSLSTILGYVWKNSDYWVVSATMGAGSLGLYYVAYVLPTIIRLRISGIFRQVMLPVLASTDGAEAQRATWAKAARQAFVLGIPVFCGLIAVSSDTLRTFFGHQWVGAARAMQLVTIAAFTDLLVQSVSTLAIAQQRYIGRATVLLGIRAALTAVAAFVGGLTFGTISAVAAGVLLASLATLIVQEFYLSRQLGIGLRVLGWDLARYAAAAAIMVIGVLLVQGLMGPRDPWLALGVGVVAGVLIFVPIARLLAGQLLLDFCRHAVRLVRGG